jgi:manganese/zinc/iron transport system permease protein
MSAVVVISLLFAPQRGLVARARQHARQRWQFAQEALAVHLLQHEGTVDAHGESSLAHMGFHMRWSAGFADQVVQRAVNEGLMERTKDEVRLTERGRETAQQAVVR